MKRVVKIIKNDYQDTNEWWGVVYDCPRCGQNTIWHDFMYCPKCGRKIEWVDDSKEAKDENN